MDVNKRILLTLLIIIISVCSGVKVFAAEKSDIDKEIAAEEVRMRDLERKIDDHRRKAQQIGTQERTVLGELSKLQENTAILQQQNKVISLKTQKLRTDIDKLNKDIMETRAKVDQLVAQLRLRLINISRYGDAENLKVFFSAESTHDVMNSIYLLEKLSVQDQRLIDELLDHESLLLENNKRLTKNNEELTSESDKLKNKQLEYNNAISATNKFLADVRKQKALQEQAARDAEAAQREIGRTVADLMRRKRERIAVETQNPNAPKRTDYTYLATGSMLDWPLSGQVVSPFGNRVHPVFKTRSAHSG
ncbi:MAG: hypothetical protein FWE49_04390, partial [Synergistaceae bacterium]|nr:hypothetical protein [Synergistaceae bacterium]